MHDIYKKYPALADTLPVVEIAALPTPVKRLERLGEAAGLSSLWVKRDDISGAAYGGNKVRKLEFLLADAIEQDYEDVLTFGAVGSNHALATALYAKRFGLKPHVVLSDQPPSESVKRKLRYHLKLETDVIAADGIREMMAAAAETTSRIANRGRKTYRVPFGGSSPIGCIGFVNAAFELAAQVAEGLLPEPEAIYIACGTTGSATGLNLGLRLAGLATEVVAVQVTPGFLSGPAAHQTLFEQTNRLLHALDRSIPLLNEPFTAIRHCEDQFGDGYAEPTAEGKAAVRLIRQHEGVELEGTYTGKALAALLADAGTLGDTPVLFWNTYNSRSYPELEAGDAQLLPESIRHYLD